MDKKYCSLSSLGIVRIGGGRGVLSTLPTGPVISLLTTELWVECSVSQTWKKPFFNSETLGIKIWRKKTKMTTNLKSRQNTVNQIFSPNAFFFSFWQASDKDITMLYTKYLHILHHLQAMKMTFLKLFLIFTFKGAKLAEKWTNLAENQNKSWTPWSLWSLFFASLERTRASYELSEKGLEQVMTVLGMLNTSNASLPLQILMTRALLH